MKLFGTLTSVAAAVLMVGCAHNERADYESDVYPKTYTSSETVTATSEFDKTPDRSDTTRQPRVDPDGRIVVEAEDEQLKAGPQTQVDQQLAQRIRQTLTDSSDISSEMDDVRITVMKGNVSLKGWVGSDADKSKIEEIICKFAGVNSVDNDLQVGNPDND